MDIETQLLEDGGSAEKKELEFLGYSSDVWHRISTFYLILGLIFLGLLCYPMIIYVMVLIFSFLALIFETFSVIMKTLESRGLARICYLILTIFVLSADVGCLVFVVLVNLS